jgi:hypothetical protein
MRMTLAGRHPIEVMRGAIRPVASRRVPVAVHICPTHMSKADYEQVMGDLAASGLGEPEGRLYHAAYGEGEVQMFEVWRSPEEFDAHRDQLFSVLQGAGVDAGAIDVHPLHSG